MSEDRSRYIVELVAEEQQFAAGTKKAVADLNKVGDAAQKLDRTRLSNLKQIAAAEERAKRFNRLSDTQKLVVLEERRLALAKQLAYAEGRGNARQAGMIRGRLAGLDETAAGIGAGSSTTGSRGRGKKGLASYGARGLIQGLSTAGGMGLGEVAEVSAMAAAIYAIGRTIVSVFKEAYEASSAVQQRMEQTRKDLSTTEGATEAMAGFVEGLATIWMGIKKGFGEVFGIILNGIQLVVGGVEASIGALMQTYGMKKMGSALRARGSGYVTEAIGNFPESLGGVGGLGESGVVTGEGVLEKASKKRAKERAQERMSGLKSEASGITSLLGSAGGSSQGLASAGLFAAAGQQGMNARLLTIQGQMLAELRAEVRAVQAVERAVKENGV